MRIIFKHTQGQTHARQYKKSILNQQGGRLFLSLLFLFSLGGACESVRAQEPASDFRPSWYIGLQGGPSFAVSSLSSFGADKTRAGYGLGLHVGRRFSPLLSLEAQAAWGHIAQSARACCTHYWLGSDGNRYEAAVAGMEGCNYDDLRGSTFAQRYGLQLNVNLLALLASTRHSRWSVEVAPHLAAVGTRSTLHSLSHTAPTLHDRARWHLGLGGNLQAGCRVSPLLYVGIYSGLTHLTGRSLDGLVHHWHKVNVIWESGVRISIQIGKSAGSTSLISPTSPVPVLPQEEDVQGAKEKEERP